MQRNFKIVTTNLGTNRKEKAGGRGCPTLVCQNTENLYLTVTCNKVDESQIMMEKADQ